MLQADKAAFEEKGVELIVSSQDLPPPVAGAGATVAGAKESANTELRRFALIRVRLVNRKGLYRRVGLSQAVHCVARASPFRK